MSRVGFLGVGHLADYLVPSLLRDLAPGDLLLSPRNQARARALAERHGLTFAADNQALVAACDIVLLATRSGQALEAVTGLPWRADHTLVSLCAGVPLAQLAPHVGPASLARALPISSALIGESPTLLTPDRPDLRALLAPLGPVLALPDEATFEIAGVSSAFYGWVHALTGEIARWSHQAGLPEPVARQLIAQTVRGAAGMVLAEPGRPIDDMIRALATPGGITELGLESLRNDRAFGPWHEACQAVLDRLTAPR